MNLVLRKVWEPWIQEKTYNVTDPNTSKHQNHAVIILYVLQFILGDVKVHATWLFPQISSANAVQEGCATFITSSVRLPRPC